MTFDSSVTFPSSSKTPYTDFDFDSLTISDDEKKANLENYKYKHLLPQYPDVDWKPLEIVDVPKDKALLADSGNNYANLLRDATFVRNINPKIGTEIVGVKLGELDDVQKNELALLVSKRIVVFFRDQKDFDIHQQLEFGKYFGPLHKHPNTGIVSYDGVHYDGLISLWSDVPRTRESNLHNLWHSDASFELQPPGYAVLKIIQIPATGGDTYWSSGYAVYDTLSVGFRSYLESLTAVHSDIDQAQNTKNYNNHIRRPPISTEHPVIRTHPVTGYKSVYVNRTFTKYIKGIPKSESNVILNYLYSLTETQQASVRFKWNENDVAIWDNRASYHNLTADYVPGTRHGIRVTSIGESPYYNPESKSQQEDIDAEVRRRKNLK